MNQIFLILGVSNSHVEISVVEEQFFLASPKCGPIFGEIEKLMQKEPFRGLEMKKKKTKTQKKGLEEIRTFSEKNSLSAHVIKFIFGEKSNK